MRNKLFLLILFVLLAITVFSDWSNPQIVWLYGNCYYPPVMSNSLSGDNSGNIYTVWYDLSMDFYMNITMRKHNGSSWQPYQRVDDPLNGQGDYGLSWMPSISVSPDGKYLIAWEDYRTGNFEIHSKFYNGVDVPSQIQVTSDSAYCWYPKLLYGAGAHHLMYISNKTGYFNIYHSSFDSAWHTAERVTDTDVNILDFHYTVNRDSSIDLVFTAQNGNYISLYETFYDGNVWGNPVPLIEGNYNIYNPITITNNTVSIVLFKSEEEGVSRIIGMKTSGLNQGNSVPLSDNSSNAMYPSGFIADSILYLYYVSDEIPTGILKERQFRISDISMISDKDILKEKGGEIYYPQSYLDSDGDINLLFVCADTIHDPHPSSVYFMENPGVFKIKGNKKPYSFDMRMKTLLFDNTEIYTVQIINKIGQTVHMENSIKNRYSFSDLKLKNDVYYMIIKSDKNKYTEKILWLD